jgi:hypothetical protein
MIAKMMTGGSTKEVYTLTAKDKADVEQQAREIIKERDLKAKAQKVREYWVARSEAMKTAINSRVKELTPNPFPSQRMPREDV